MAELEFNIEGNNPDVINKTKEIRKIMMQMSVEAELRTGNINSAINKISIDTLEKVRDAIETLPNEIKGFDLLNKQFNDFEICLEEIIMKIVELQNRTNEPISVKIISSEITKLITAYDMLIKSMKEVYQQLSKVGHNVDFGTEIVKQIQEADDEMEQLGSTMKNFQRIFADYKGQWDDLNLGIQQIGGDLPNLETSAKAIFSAIGKNIPNIVDSVKNVRIENVSLAKQSKATIPVWKQVASSFFSWQTVLNVGLTLLSEYSDELIDWVENLAKGDKQINSSAELRKSYNDIMKQSSKDAQQELIKLRYLYEATQDNTRSLSDRKRAVAELKKENPNYFKGLSDEAILAGKATDKYKDLATNILNVAKAKAIEKKAAEYGEKLVDNEVKKGELQKKYDAAIQEYHQLTGGESEIKMGIGFNAVAFDGALSSAMGKAHKIKEAIGKLDEESLEYNNIIKKLGQSINIDQLVGTENDDTTNNNQAETIRNQQKHLNDLIENQSRERQRLEEDLINQRKQADIDANYEGDAKILEQMKFNHTRELQELEHEKQDFIRQQVKDAEDKFNAEEDLKNAKNPKRIKSVFDSKGAKIAANEQLKTKGFDTHEANIRKKQENEINAFYDSQKQAMNEYLKEYGTYQEKRQAITELYNDKINKAKTEGEKLSLGKDMTKELSDLDIEANKATASFSKLFSDMSKSSVKDMRAISSEAKSALEYVKGGKFETGSDGKGKYGISKETFSHYQDSPEEVKQMEERVEDLNAEADKCETGFNKMGIGFKNFFNAGSDPKKVREALSEIEAGMGEVMQAGQFLSNTFASLGDSLGSDTLGQVAEGMNVAMDAAGAAMSGAQAGAMFGPWGAAAGAAIGLVSSLGSSLAKLHDAKKEKNIQRIQEQIEVLEKSYGKLGESIDKSYSSDASKLIEQQNTLLEQQKVLIQNQIAEEKGKKKADNGRIKDWENQIEEINKAIAEGKEKAIDVLLGEDVKAAIDNFAQAYADAWAAGDDRAKSSKDLVKSMIKQMIMEAMKATTSAPMEKLRQKLAGYFSDGIISAWEREQIEKDAEAIANELDDKYGWADEYMKGDSESTSQESSKGGFESMSQETGSELNGRFAALQVANEEMRNSMQSVVINLSSLHSSVTDGNLTLTEMRNLAVMSNSYLQDIAGYTKRILVDFGGKLDNIITNTKGL